LIKKILNVNLQFKTRQEILRVKRKLIWPSDDLQNAARWMAFSCGHAHPAAATHLQFASKDRSEC
jgi:hypothetical protein